jgi:hypothetical protein
MDRKIEKGVRLVSARSVTAIVGMRFEFPEDTVPGFQREWFLFRQVAF